MILSNWFAFISLVVYHPGVLFKENDENSSSGRSSKVTCSGWELAQTAA